MKGTIDAIDEGVVRIELDGGGVCRLPLRAIPAGARAGDRVDLEVRIDRAATAAARAQVSAQQRRLAESDEGGDIEL